MAFTAPDFRGSAPMKSRGLYGHHMGVNGFPTSILLNPKQKSKTKTPSKNKKTKKPIPIPPSPPWSLNGRVPGVGMPPLRGANPKSRSCTPIMFSNSRGMLKPPPVEKKLECTLEELCYGCQKKIKIIREVLTATGSVVSSMVPMIY